jgi:1,2-diacylglycerol 3-beta-glucosyltransferase
VRRRSLVLLDLAADLLVPPLTYVVLATLVGAIASGVCVGLGRAAWWALLPWSCALLAVALYVARGVWLARVGPRAILDLLWAPVYMLWKVAIAMRRSSAARGGKWVRTAREGEKR